MQGEQGSSDLCSIFWLIYELWHVRGCQKDAYSKGPQPTSTLPNNALTPPQPQPLAPHHHPTNKAPNAHPPKALTNQMRLPSWPSVHKALPIKALTPKSLIRAYVPPNPHPQSPSTPKALTPEGPLPSMPSPPKLLTQPHNAITPQGPYLAP